MLKPQAPLKFIFISSFVLVAPLRAQNLGDLSSSNLRSFETQIQKRRAEVLENLSLSIANNSEAATKALSNEEMMRAREKAKRESVIQVYDLILSNVNRLQSLNPQSAEYQSLAYETKILESATRVEGNRLDSRELVDQALLTFKEWKVKRSDPSKAEASNLYNSQKKRFYTQAELARLGDVSQLNPLSSLRIWEKRDISKVDVKQSYLGGQNALYRDLNLNVQAPQNEVYLDYVITSQSKPKFAVHARTSDGSEVKYKLKVALETHSDPTVSALSTALGFYNDLTFHVKDLKVYLGSTTFEQFKFRFSRYYDRYEITKYLKSNGQGGYTFSDAKGAYVVFLHGSLELKAPGILRAGPWAWGAEGIQSLREARALLLFNIWVGNNDLKEAENNEILVKKESTNSKLYLIQHDLGASIGELILENPGAFPLRLIKNPSNKNEVAFNFKSLQENSGFKSVTYSDLKWMARLIAQLSEKQIRDAVDLGAWPQSMGDLVFEKLKARRNQIVQAFELEAEGFRPLIVNSKLSTPDGAVVNGKIKRGEVQGFPQDFDVGILDFAAPELKKVGHGLVRLITSGLSSVSRVSLPALELGLDSAFFSTVLLNSSREFEKNPAPRDPSENYIVKDRFEIGYELSPGYVLGSSARVVWTYTLVYPAATRNEAQYAGKTILNLLLPISAKRGDLPQRYVLVTENSLEGAGFLRSNDFAPLFPIGLQVSSGVVKLGRSIVSNTDGKTLRFYKDKQLMNENAARFFAALVQLRVPLMRIDRSKGSLEREILELPLSKTQNARVSEAVKKAMSAGDVEGLRSFAKVSALESKFTERLSRYTWLLMGAKNEYRYDRIQDEAKLSWSEGRDSRRAEWSFLDNGEAVESRIILSSKPSADRTKIKAPVLHLHFSNTDKNTKTDELARGYINFANVVANDARFINFTPEAHSANGYWGHMNVVMNVVYSTEAINALLKVDRGEFWKRVMASAGLRPDPVALHRATAVSNRLGAAKEESDENKRMEEIVKALRAATYKKGVVDSTLDGRLLGILNEMIEEQIGRGKIFMNAFGANDGSVENKMPGRMRFYGVRGNPVERDEPNMLFGDESPVEIYQAL